MEYARFGVGFVRREDDTYEWEDCPIDDVPPEAIAQINEPAERRERIRKHGYDPQGDLPGARFVRKDGVDL